MAPRKKRFVTIQILPDGAGAAWTFKLRRPFFEFLFYALVIALFAAGFAAVKITQIQGKVFLANHMAVQNQELLMEQQKMAELEHELAEVNDKEKAVRNILEAFLSQNPETDRAAATPGWTGGDIGPYLENLRSINRRLESRDVSLVRARQPSMWPVKGILSQRFSLSGDAIHEGIDILAEENTVVVSAGRGVVVEEGWDNDLGRYVRVNHDFQLETVYGHMARVFVKVGDQVAKGDPVGLVGTTGRSLGPHLHFEIIFKGKPVDPLSYLE